MPLSAQTAGERERRKSKRYFDEKIKEAFHLVSECHRSFAGTPELHERHRPRLFAHAYSAISRRICARCCCRCRCYPGRRFVLVFLVRALSFHRHENVCRMRFVFRRQRRRVFFTLSNQFVFFFFFFLFFFLLCLLLLLFHSFLSKSFTSSVHHHHRIVTYILYLCCCCCYQCCCTMDCRVFFSKNEILCVFSQLIFLEKRSSSLPHNTRTLSLLLLLLIIIIIIISHQDRW